VYFACIELTSPFDLYIIYRIAISSCLLFFIGVLIMLLICYCFAVLLARELGLDGHRLLLIQSY
jgi:hypothetical protein